MQCCACRQHAPGMASQAEAVLLPSPHQQVCDSREQLWLLYTIITHYTHTCSVVYQQTHRTVPDS